MFAIRCKTAGVVLSVTQKKLEDDAVGIRHQHIVAAGLHPMVAAWRRTQMVAAPVIDHVLTVAIFGRQALASVELVVGAGASLTFPFTLPIVFPLTSLIAAELTTAPVIAIILRPSLVIAMVLLPLLVVATISLIIALLLLIAITIILSKGKTSCGQGYRHEGGNNCFQFRIRFHIRLHSMGSTVFVACT